MMDENTELFVAFKVVHDNYQADRKRWSQEFHQQGQVIVDIIRNWERRLCAGMERGNNGVYSSRLAEKFWGEVKTYLPLIERVGVKSNLD